MASIPNAKEEEGGVGLVVVVVTLGIKANTTKDAALLLLLVIVVLVLLLRLLLLDDTHTRSITVKIILRHDATAVDVADNDAVMPRRQEEYGLNILADYSDSWLITFE